MSDQYQRQLTGVQIVSAHDLTKGAREMSRRMGTRDASRTVLTYSDRALKEKPVFRPLFLFWRGGLNLARLFFCATFQFRTVTRSNAAK
jgi:hypothetical protein